MIKVAAQRPDDKARNVEALIHTKVGGHTCRVQAWGEGLQCRFVGSGQERRMKVTTLLLVTCHS